MDAFVKVKKRRRRKRRNNSKETETSETSTQDDVQQKASTEAGQDDPLEGGGASSIAAVSSSIVAVSRGFELIERPGDLFGCPEDESLAHCISEDVAMGKGIAKIFKEKFGGVRELINQGVKPGGVAVLKREQRYVYYLVTKTKYWNKPTYDSLARSLRAMAHHCLQHDVRRVSMPRIGCGLDKLQWYKVANVISDTLNRTDVTVTVYTL